MAKYRQLQTKFWTDPFVESLTPEQKYFYIYLVTNPATTQCGIYEITFKTMAYQTGYNSETVEKLMTFFEMKEKIKYTKSTSEICILNFQKHNWTKSPKVIACIQKEMTLVKDRSLVETVYGMDTLSQKKEKKEKKEEEKEKQSDLYTVEEISKSIYFKDARRICEYFGFSLELHPDKYILCCDFLSSIDSQEKLDYFRKSFASYTEYKSITKEMIHGLHSFLGKKSEAFLDGGWNSNNWELKLTDYKSKENIGPQIKEDIKNYKFK
jgi:hypothetical protein